MQIEVNGEPREVPGGTTVSELLALLRTDDGPVAVERNAEIVPRAAHATTELCNGDHVEVVQFVGGGKK